MPKADSVSSTPLEGEITTSAPISPRATPRAVSPYTRTSLVQLASRWVKSKVRRRPENSLKEVLEEALEEEATESLDISQEEKKLLKNMIHFGETTVNDIMVPRTDIMAVERDTSLSELKQHIIHIGHTRVPVYHDSLDKIEGFVHVKDLLPFFATGETFEIDTVLREVLFVPPSMLIVDLLVKMRVSGCHMAIVVDEYGGTDGLITMEDLFEELVGEIQDEHDGDEYHEQMVWHGEHILEADPRVGMFALEETLGESLIPAGSIPSYDTLGGLIFTQLGRVPVKGEVLQVSSRFKIEILQADPRRIHRVRITRH